MKADCAELVFAIIAFAGLAMLAGLIPEMWDNLTGSRPRPEAS